MSKCFHSINFTLKPSSLRCIQCAPPKFLASRYGKTVNSSLDSKGQVLLLGLYYSCWALSGLQNKHIPKEA